MKKLPRRLENELYERGMLGDKYIQFFYGGASQANIPWAIYIPQVGEQFEAPVLHTSEPCCQNKELPTVSDMAKGLVESAAAWAKAGYKLASKEEHAKRMARCASCEFLTENKRCLKCGCFMELKSRLEGMKCPIAIW